MLQRFSQSRVDMFTKIGNCRLGRSFQYKWYHPVIIPGTVCISGRTRLLT